MLTFMSLTHAPSTPLSVLVARATASLMASSKLVSDVALNSVTLATLTELASLNPSLLLIYLICSLAGQKSNMTVIRNPVDHFWMEARSFFLPLAQAVCQGVDIEVGRVHYGRFWEVPWRRVFLADAAIEDDDFVVASDLSPVAQ